MGGHQSECGSDSRTYIIPLNDEGDLLNHCGIRAVDLAPYAIMTMQGTSFDTVRSFLQKDIVDTVGDDVILEKCIEHISYITKVITVCVLDITCDQNQDPSSIKMVRQLGNSVVVRQPIGIQTFHDNASVDI